MGYYLNPSTRGFQNCLNSEIYVDKTGLIESLNKLIDTEQRYVCVSRPRRFGKSMAIRMLSAYYGGENDSDPMFKNLEIAQYSDYKKYLNKYIVLCLNMQEFLSDSSSTAQMEKQINQLLMREIKKNYADIDFFDETNLIQSMKDIYEETRQSFIVLIDEWDCIFREYKNRKNEQERYLDFLRKLLKDKEYISLAYMTGILPIKKYGTHSALNMFMEFSMLNPKQLSCFVGFTNKETQKLCQEFGRNFDEIKEWYDGYHFVDAISVYNPKSVVEAVLSGICDTYWNQTETFEALRIYIDMNFEGLRDDVLCMMSGKSVWVNTGNFTNDMITFHTKDDVLTLLIHLGYLGYDYSSQCVFIPNNEIRKEFYNAVSVSDWGEVSKSLLNASATLDAIWAGKTELVAKSMEQAHFETSQIQYHDENALSYTISLALYTARNFYTIVRELPTGKGFADMVYIPRKKFQNKPALVVELKWDKSVKGAIEQIKEKQYCKSLEEYRGNILLVGIGYDKKTKEHKCMIEEDYKE